ncbi:MAG: hypothetical protein ACTH2Q_04925 [Propionibacteriaceae bacterium]
MAEQQMSTILKVQVGAVSVVGAVAVILFVVAVLTSGDTSDMFMRAAAIAGVACAVIGVTFAFTASKAVKE